MPTTFTLSETSGALTFNPDTTGTTDGYFTDSAGAFIGEQLEGSAFEPAQAEINMLTPYSLNIGKNQKAITLIAKGSES